MDYVTHLKPDGTYQPLREHEENVAALAGKFAEAFGAKAHGERTGLLHDIDFEQWPEQHCVKAPELLREGGAEESIIHAVCSHGWAICVDIKPEHEMEKLLYAADELTGLIGAAALMRPSKSVQDMELKSLKKKYKDKSSRQAARVRLLSAARSCVD